MATGIRYIFCINTGRSGSKYLAELFLHIQEIVSLHEPSPQLNGYVMQQYLLGDKGLMQNQIQKKLNEIYKLPQSKQVYIETTHCFIKGFGWELMKHLPQQEVGVIILRRNYAEVARSYQKLGCTQFTFKSKKWLAPHGLYLKTMKSWHVNFQFYVGYAVYTFLRLLRKSGLIKSERKYLPSFVLAAEERYLTWYCEKTDELTTAFKEEFPEVKYYELDFTRLNDKTAIESMMDYFDMTRYKDIVLNGNLFGRKVNDRSK